MELFRIKSFDEYDDKDFIFCEDILEIDKTIVKENIVNTKKNDLHNIIIKSLENHKKNLLLSYKNKILTKMCMIYNKPIYKIKIFENY